MGGDLFDYPTGGGVAMPESPCWPRRHPPIGTWFAGTVSCAAIGPASGSAARTTPIRVLWIVVDGRFAVASGGGSEEELGAGAVFGELTFLTGAPDEATVHARRDGSVLRLRLADLEVLAGLHPVLARHLLFDLARLLAWRLRELRRAAQR